MELNLCLWKLCTKCNHTWFSCEKYLHSQSNLPKMGDKYSKKGEKSAQRYETQGLQFFTLRNQKISKAQNLQGPGTVLPCSWQAQSDFLLFLSFFLSFFFFLLFRATPTAPQHMEVPRLGADSELQLPAYATATATWDSSRVCDLHHTCCQTLNPLIEARDWTRILMDTSLTRFHWATIGTPDHLTFWTM